jgi:hypothetical protein
MEEEEVEEEEEEEEGQKAGRKRDPLETTGPN